MTPARQTLGDCVSSMGFDGGLLSQSEGRRHQLSNGYLDLGSGAKDNAVCLRFSVSDRRHTLLASATTNPLLSPPRRWRLVSSVECSFHTSPHSGRNANVKAVDFMSHQKSCPYSSHLPTSSPLPPLTVYDIFSLSPTSSPRLR